MIAFALLLSGAILEATILPTGTIVGTARRATALNGCRFLIALNGLYLLVKRPRFTAVHLTAFAAVGVFSVLGGAVLLQAAYVPPAVLSGWRSVDSQQREQNQFGFRGRPIAYGTHDRVIVMLGDSQVEATAMAMDSMPERRLEAHLGVPDTKVFSLGAGGYGQDQELLSLEGYLKTYRADLVVLWETPLNDVWNNVFKTHITNRNPKPTFWLNDAGKLEGPSEGLLAPLGNSKVVFLSLFQRAFGLPWRDKSWERHLPEPYVPLEHYDGPVRKDWQTRWDTNVGRMRDENLDTEKTHMSVLLSPRSKRMQYGVDLTHALIQRIREVVRTQGGELVVFYADTHSFETEDDEIYVLNGKYYRVSKRQYEANLRDINNGFVTEVIPVTIPNWRVSAEDGHLNREATDQVMSALADRLREKVTHIEEPRRPTSE